MTVGNSIINTPTNITEHWQIVVISNNLQFINYFNNASENKLFGLKVNFIINDQLTESLLKTISSDINTVIHIETDEVFNPDFINRMNKLKLDTQPIHPYIVVWSSGNGYQDSNDQNTLNFINEFRSITGLSNQMLAHILYSNIRNQEQVIELEQLRNNLECKIAERTIKLTEANKKLQEYLIKNTNTQTKLNQQRIQIEKQNEEIVFRNQELELAFKKSSKQHIQLHKLLIDNEKQRGKLELVLNEIQTKNDTLQLKNEEIITQRDYIEQQNEEIQAQRDVAIGQRDKITEQQQEITDNILYASRIQHALFPPVYLMKQLLPTHFILNKPKDVVSGDFYWIAQNKNKTVIAVADCTGHGISGAMMSMLGTAFLNEIVNKDDVTNSTAILEQLRQRVISSLHQTISDNFEYSRDGMDISIAIIDIVDNTLEYSGANNPIYIFRNDELIELKPDKMPIGIHEFFKEPFNAQTINLSAKDTIVLFSDGYADQFGGANSKKLKYSKFKSILAECCKLPNKKRSKMLEYEFEQWRGENDQIDDVLVVGFEIN